MKRRDVERHLRKYGCRFDHHGGKHDVWLNPSSGTDTVVPRHPVLKRGTVRAICKELQIPTPAGL